MSSTVGYGIEVAGNAFGEPVADGDWEEELIAQFPELTVERSAPEYSGSEEDSERIFVLIKSSVVKAGGFTKSAAAFIGNAPDPILLDMFVAESGAKKIGPASWKLIDYYSY